MASSDDEGETFPDAVSDYYFYDKKDEPLSFSKLAVQWNESERSSANVGPIFLGGTVDNGLRKFYQQVKAWKYEFVKATPEISVLFKDNHWMKLIKPRKSFENLIRTILITVHSLCFFKSKPEASGKSLWDHLSKVFSSYDVRPSENDLIEHMNFIREAVKRDETLAKSKFLAEFLDDPKKKRFSDEDVGTATKPSFIVDDMNDEPQDDDFITKESEDSESDEEKDHFDSVCAICDNGGVLTCCEGKCFRSFHATGESEEAQDSKCRSLGLTPEQLEGTQQYKCENCQYSLHECFVCGELGSSDKSSNTEVFRCSSATCGHFYHPQCVARLLQKNDKAEQQSLKEKICTGEPFICPAHKCAVCKQTENEKVEDLQFAICRRCPTSYHRKCLPRDIMFEDQIGDDDDTRAWDGLLPKSRALIYCMKHEIDEELGTPARTLKFKNILVDSSKTEQPSQPLKKKKIAVKEKSVIQSQKGVEKRSNVPEGSSKKRPAVSSGPESLKKKKVLDTSKNSLRRNLSTKVKKPSSNDGQPTLGSRLYDLYTGTESNKLEKDDTCVDDISKQTTTAGSLQNEILPPIDDDSKQRILALMKDTASSITLDEIKKYHKGKVPSTHAHSSRVDKSIILARVEGSVEALHVALKKLEEGCSIEDAMAVCEPGVIDQILRWKEKLKVYLAPFLHGMRYTSFGRHFTKVEKLEKIVDKLQWYIEDGDTVVDFCCGANDFSCLVKKRLDEMGKKRCSYKNFDITRPKNDFNFEKRDWMTVGPKELPCGSQLIMGLNPPFGKNAALANQFIDSALRFKPKLIVLIVPSETERLDSKKKKTPYDLIWEDVELLAGKSFYLPGSVDVNDKQMDQWNNSTPPLYLWSRPDWTNKHKSIAQQHGHIPKSQTDETVPESGLSIGTNLVQNDVSDPLDDLPVIIEDRERITEKAKKTDIKKRKKDFKNKMIIKEETSNPSLSKRKRNRRYQERKLEKHSREVEDMKNEKARDLSREDRAQKDDIVRDLSREDRAQKHDNIRELSREVESLKHDESRGPFREFEAQKNDNIRVSSREENRGTVHEFEAQKLANKHNLASTREIESQKREENRGPFNEFEAQKLANKYNLAPTREVESQKREENRDPFNEFEAQKLANKYNLSSTREIESQKHEENRGSLHEFETQKLVNKYISAPTREDQAKKHEENRDTFHEFEHKKYNNLAPTRETRHSDFASKFEKNKRSPAHTRDSDFSFVDDERYNSSIDESTFSFQNDIGQPFDHLLERRYNPTTTAEPYVGPTYRRLDGPSPGHGPRPEPVQYSGYDRVGRGSYFDEPSARVSSYSMAHHEPGLTRYGSVDASTFNRTSTSAMQRYAPRLDELNHTMVNNLGRGEPVMGNRVVGGYGPPMVHGPPPPGFRSDNIGFAPGPYNPYSQHNSSGGWLNE